MSALCEYSDYGTRRSSEMLEFLHPTLWPTSSSLVAERMRSVDSVDNSDCLFGRISREVTAMTRRGFMLFIYRLWPARHT